MPTISTAPIRRIWPMLLLAAVSGALSQPAYSGALYRWTDADGSVHFSDSLPLQMPPSGFQGTRPPTVGEAMAEQAEHDRLARIEARRRALEAEQKQREKTALLEAAAREMERRIIISPYSCEEARQTLAAQRAPRRTYYSVDADGRFQPSTAEEAQRNIAEWEQAVEQLCADNVTIVAPGSPEAEKALADSARWGGGSGETEPATQTPQ